MPEYLSKEKFEKLKEELKYLKAVKRNEIKKRIEESLNLGDLSENAEYAEAKEAKAFNEGRILELEEILKNAVIVTGQNGRRGEVDIGSTVRVKTGKEIQEFTIVGSEESDPAQGKISNESPLGRAFFGKKAKDTVEISTPRGKKIKYTILSIK